VKALGCELTFLRVKRFSFGGPAMEIGRGSGSKAIEIPFLVIVPILAAYVMALELSRDTLDIVVEDKNVVMGSEDASDTSSKWLVYTSTEVFTVAGDWTRGEFYAGERFAELEPGRAYRVQVAGWRVPPINWYRKIVRIEQPGSGGE
jgi:hypothetical protein